MQNEILLRRKHKVTVDLKTPLNKIVVESLTHLFTFELNLSSLGFSLEQNFALVLAKQPVAVIDDLYKELIPALQALIGADKEYKVMYPNFPKQVAEADDAELWINAILHYISFGTSIPLVIDCKERKVIWTDLSKQIGTERSNNLENNLVGTTLAAYAMVNLKRTTMFQVAVLNTLARGKVVERVEDADVIFTADEEGIKKALVQEPREKSDEPRIITQWDLDVFMSDLI